MGIVSTLLRAVTWWNGQTIGTQIYTWRHGSPVGTDESGNRYYQSSNGARRWVIFDGEVEASRIGPDWHGWLHHTYQEPPTQKPLPRKVWEKPHHENLTGSTLAYAPSGSIRRGTPEAHTDYEAWTPE